MEEYTRAEYADLIFEYGCANENSRQAHRLHRDKYPRRRHPAHIIFSRLFQRPWVAQLGEQLATDWKVRGSIPSGDRIFSRCQTSRTAPRFTQPPIKLSTGSFPGVKGGQSVVPTTPPHSSVEHGYRDLICVSEKNEWRLTGYDGEIMYELQYRLNFTTIFSIPKDRQYGIPKENGTWNGMVQKVATNQVTIGIGPFDYTDDRLDVVSYLPPIWNYNCIVCRKKYVQSVRLRMGPGKRHVLIRRFVRAVVETPRQSRSTSYQLVTVYIRQPDIVMSTLQQILSPFSLEVWLVIMTIVVSLIASLASIWRLYSTHFSTRDDNAFNIQEYTTHVLGIFLLQGHGATLRILSWRLVYFVTYFLSTVLFIAYSAKFISNLSVRRPSLPFTDFEGLLEDGSYKIRLLAGNVYGKYLQVRTDYGDDDDGGGGGGDRREGKGKKNN
ncbi:hypothetical protein ANN_21226 [Periplaneta americana]|uniref:Ionotropic glutamate receptor L-glutamate and glycine-binding domain-containing protein n=1 Tax=Periplaneta americana TaxID=6978 RepID=A0ABQ8SF28_PERAM|nr:hypothetical protein ANN_21226 [Periplaneta americana]